MKEEIIGGLKNAMERGATLAEAARSFISAGYNPQEVKQAAMQIHSGAIQIISDIEKQGAKNVKMQAAPGFAKKAIVSTQLPQQTQQPQQARPAGSSPMRPVMPSIINRQRFPQSTIIAGAIPRAKPLPITPPAIPSSPFVSKTTIGVLVMLLLLFIFGLIAMLSFRDKLVDFILNSYGS